MTREEWLEQAAIKLEELLSKEAGVTLKNKIRVSCGWPTVGALSATHRRTGECHVIEASGDKVNEIFVSPYTGDPQVALCTVLHELIHASDNCASGHKGYFKKIHHDIGFIDKPTMSVPGDMLAARLNVIAMELGPYPHHTLDPRVGGKKKQTTRLIKAVCPTCGYVIRTTRQWIDKGLPVCPCGTQFTLPGNVDDSDEGKEVEPE